MEAVTIQNAPQFLNINDQAMWVLGYNEAVQKVQCTGCAVQQGTHVPAEAVVQIQEPVDAARAEFESFSKFSKCEWSLEWDKAGFYVDRNTDSAFTWFQHGYQRSKLAAVQQAALEPFGYVNTHTGQFFKDVEPCRKNNEGHWRTVYTYPTQQGLDAQRWQIVHNRISGEYIAGRAHFVVQIPPVPDTNIMRGSVAEHFTKAVDFAVAQEKQGA